MNKKFLLSLIASLVATSMVLTACQPPAPPTAAPVETAAPVATEPPAPAFKACQVTDTGGIDDKSFNATAWKGIEDSIKELGIEGKYLESQQQTDHEKNINPFTEKGCNITS